MNFRSKPQKPTSLNLSNVSEQAEIKDKSWLHAFFLVLGLISVIAAAVIYYYISNYSTTPEQDIYVSVKVKAVIGIEKIVACKLSLLVDPEQESGLIGQKKLLEAVVSQALIDAYQNTERPDLSDVRENLYLKINQKLPQHLQVQEVFVQELTVGFR
jgi:hypothetical protein